MLLNYASVFARYVAQNRARRCHRSEMARHDYALAFRQRRILSYRVYLSHGPQGFWQVNDKLSFDVAVRYALVDGLPVSEFRAGLTFGFPLNLGRPMAAETANAAVIGRR